MHALVTGLPATITMYSFPGRRGPPKTTPTNVLCQKCLKRDTYCPISGYPIAKQTLLTCVFSLSTPLLVRVQGGAPGPALQGKAIAVAAAAQPEAGAEAARRDFQRSAVEVCFLEILGLRCYL